MASAPGRSALVALAATLCTAALPAMAETPKWDQAAVTAAAQALVKDIDAVQLAFRREIATMAPSGDRRTRFELTEDLRLLGSGSRQLARQLEAGKDRDETYPVFRRLEGIRRDAAQAALRLNITQPTLEKIKAARTHLESLAAFYGEKLPPPVLKLPKS